jgi:Tol biopolymer transport system component
VALVGSFAWAQSTERVSVATGGGEAGYSSFRPSISADGRFVAFGSGASNLVAGDSNGADDVFVHDRVAGTTDRVSVSTGGAEGDNDSYIPSISADGRFVAFYGGASNLVAGDTNAYSDVFVHDRQTATTERVSLATGGWQADYGGLGPSISSDGRFVAFRSTATNLVAGHMNSVYDVFVRDRQSGTTELVSVTTGGAEGNGNSDYCSIAGDGRFVAFLSGATNLVPGDTNNNPDIFVHDRQSATTVRASVASDGTQIDSYSAHPSISADGRFVAFQVWPDLFVRDLQGGTTEYVSVGLGGVPASSQSGDPSISPDGRFIAFWSWAINLVPGDTNWFADVFLRDRLLGTTERTSMTSSGAQANQTSGPPSVTPDGRLVAFVSYASYLVAGDTNGRWDVFVRDRGGPHPASICFGDGTGTACPCGNGQAGNGCPSSVNANGANLTVSGTESTTTDTLVLEGSGMPDSSALYIQGSIPMAGGAGVVFGDGLRCVGGTIIRLGTKSNVGGASRYPETGDPSVSVRGLVTMPGVRTYQVWYRNAADFCTPATFNLTNGLEITWLP